MHDCSLLFAIFWFIFKLQEWKTHARLFAIVRSFHASFSSSLADTKQETEIKRFFRRFPLVFCP